MIKLSYDIIYCILISINIIIVRSQALDLNLNELPYEIRQLNLPARHPKNAKLPTITKGNLKTAKELFYYTDAAYCSEDNIENWTCKNCLERPDLKLTQLGTVSAESGVWYGFLGINNKGNIIISIRGTANPSNFLIAPDVLKKKYVTKENDEMWIHSGLLGAAHSLYPGIKDKLLELKNDYPDVEVFFTGHSFGGALASIIAVLLEDESLIEWPKTHVYTFGQTRVGDQAYADYIDSRTGATFLRIVNNLDFFSNYPIRTLGYVHNQYIIFYSDDKQISCDPYVEESKCYAFLNPLDFREHSHYFGHEFSDNCNTMTGTLETLAKPILPVLDLFKTLGI
jgi:hypothetical protein